MKVTVNPKEKQDNHDIPFDEIPVGYVYVALYSDGPIALKLCNGEAMLLKYGNGDEWFTIADGYNGKPASKILGKLTEVVVEEI